MWRVTCIVAAVLLLAAGHAPAQPVLMVNLEDGAVVGDIVEVRASAASDSGIERVEFSVDDQVRATVRKPPFAYRWDTIDEYEGEHRVIVAAFDGAGRARSRRIRVEVDNGLSQGVRAHHDRAWELFRKGDLERARLAGRKAYRISQADPLAVRVMALATGIGGDYTRALDMLEKRPVINGQPQGDPKDYPMRGRIALELRGIFHIRRAAAEKDVARQAADLCTAHDLGRELAALLLAEGRAAHPEPFATPAARLAVGDALAAAGDHAAALAAYGTPPAEGPEAAALANRIALAQMALGRMREAELQLQGRINSGRGDEGTRAVLGFLHLRQRQWQRARDAVEPGLSRGSAACRVMAAYASLALRDFRGAYELAEQAARRADAAEVHAVAAGIFAQMRQPEKASAELMEALIRLPQSLDLLVARGFQVAALAPGDSLGQALSFFDGALQRAPDHPGVRLGRALALLQQKRSREAKDLLARLAREERGAADVQAAYAAALAAAGESLKATEALAAARRLDAELFPEATIPVAAELARRAARYRLMPVLTPALLAVDERR